MTAEDVQPDRFECQGCRVVTTDTAVADDHKQRHGVVISIGPAPEKFSLTMTDAEAKEWHNSRGIPWGTPFDGPEPRTVSRMQHPGEMNLSVHLSNEHGRNPDYIDVRRMGRDVAHAMFHLYGIFRAGQEHYHSQP